MKAFVLYVWSRWVTLPAVYVMDWLFRVEQKLADRIQEEDDQWDELHRDLWPDR